MRCATCGSEQSQESMALMVDDVLATGGDLESLTVTECSGCKKDPADMHDKATTDGEPADEGLELASAPKPIDPATGMHEAYWVLSDEERAKEFVRPNRTSYKHIKCGAVTTMGRKLSETYARDPSFYGATFCATCKTHLPVGEAGEFVWDGTEEKVGT